MNRAGCWGPPQRPTRWAGVAGAAAPARGAGQRPVCSRLQTAGGDHGAILCRQRLAECGGRLRVSGAQAEPAAARRKGVRKEGAQLRQATLWARLLGLKNTIVRHVDIEGEGPDAMLVVDVRPRQKASHRCGICHRKSPGYDQGEGVRRWRHLDFGAQQVYLRAAAPRVSCPRHGVVTAAVPWARHDARHTLPFDDQVAWLATHTSKSAVRDLMRIAWETVGAIATRVVDDARAATDPFAGLRRIGIDEVSYKRGQYYLSTVVDHDSGRVVWCAPGRDEATLAKFFALVGEERCRDITLVSADAGSWIARAVAKHCPNAKLCMDPFHVVSWATDAMDDVRLDVWNQARRDGQQAVATELKGARWTLWRNPEDLNAKQQARLADIARSNKPLYRAYLLKEQLRQVFQLPHDQAMELLNRWLSWAKRCRLRPFVKLAKTVTAHRADISAAIAHKLSNARLESVNTKVRLITRVAFGFRSPAALINLVLLSLGGYCPPLPGRA